MLDGLPRVPGSPYVLPAARGTGAFTSLPDALERIVVRAGLEGVTAHTLRHSFASTAGDLGYSDSTIRAMLGHAGHSVTSRYIHHLDAVLIDAADRTSEAVWQAMQTGAGPTMRRRRGAVEQQDASTAASALRQAQDF